MSSDTDLAFRKQMLLQRSAVQRQVLGVQVKQVLAPAVAVAQQARAWRQWVREHPALSAGLALGVGAALAAWRPVSWRRLWPLVPRALALWQMWQGIRSAQA